ncbi:MAG TPA: tetratricopeptide repeat protein [Salinivirgaceae bacterium]|nr:tetratricopeptide repeat protein [Salinivirgaceae bacterium]
MRQYPLIFLSLYCIMLLNPLYAQQNKDIERDSIRSDSIFKEAWKIKFKNPDSALILTRAGMELSKQSKSLQMSGYRNISVAYSIKGELDTAEYYCLKHLEIAQELNIPKSIAAAYQNLGIVASQKGYNRQALEYYNKITEIAEKTGDSSLVMRNLVNAGLSYYKLGDYTKSITILMRGLKIAEETKDTNNIINYTKNLSGAYHAVNNLELSLKWALYTYSISTEKNDLRGIGLACNTLGAIYLDMKDYDNSIKYFNIDLDIKKKIKDKRGEAAALHSLGNVYAIKGDFEKGELYYRNSLLLKKETGDNESIACTYNSLTATYIDKGDLLKAQSSIDSALFYSRLADDEKLSRNILDNQKMLAEKKGDFKTALAFADSIMIAKDSIYKEEFNKHVAELETIYKTEQKEKEIEIQNALILNQELKIKQAKLITLLILCASILFFVVIGLLYINYRKRQKEQLKLARINEQLALEKYNSVYRDMQLKVIQEKIAGQEEERSRIARELHDGVGGNLVALKLLLEQTMADPNPEDISSISSRVVKTLEEVRSISHNLMPPIFSDISIDQVLRLHIEDLNKSCEINFNVLFLTKTGWEQIDTKLQVEIYRIIQELCSNIQKYSNATQVDIQLSILDNTINVLMEDNGSPFEYTAKGIGYRNIKERLLQFDGVFDKSSGGSSGNTYHIQIPVLQKTTSEV